MVGAGAVVTKDVPPFGLVFGNPARLKGFVCYCGRKVKEKIGEDKEHVIFKCSHCGREVKIKKEDYERYLEEKDL